MAELFSIIQDVMKYQKSEIIVDVILKNLESYSGVIQKYTGTTLYVDDIEICINDIDAVKEHKDLDFSAYMMNRVLITLVSGKEIDCVLISADSEKIGYITENGQEMVLIDDIVKVSCDDEEIKFNRIKVTNKIPTLDVDRMKQNLDDTNTEKQGKEKDELLKIDTNVQSMEKIESDDSFRANTLDNTKVKVNVEKNNDLQEEKLDSYEPNAFEQGLIDGNKSIVEEFVLHEERLSLLGYTDKEIGRIRKMHKLIAWDIEPFKIANRIYAMQLNKNELARHYYEISLTKYMKGTPEYKKTLNVLVQFVLNDGDEKYILFGKQNARHLRDNQFFCNKYIEAQLRVKKININDFEKLLITADKKKVEEYLQNEENLLSLNYSKDDIERIVKAYNNVNWETSWYRTATRLFGMQLNKNRLAEVYYEAALIIAGRKGDEYNKILNALASIKMNEDTNEYIAFFKMYRDKLKTNSNYCKAYANALLSQQNWMQIEKDMKMFKEQLGEEPSYLERIQAEVSYYKSASSFVLDNNTELAYRYANDSILYNQEKNLIEKLPDRSALKSLLEIYYSNREEKAYFELVDYALFFIKEEKEIMLKLLTMLHSTENMSYVVHFLPKIPVLWCDADLVKKYINNTVDTSDFKDMNNADVKLKSHIRSIGSYRSLNSFETGIVNCDYDEVRRYIDNAYLLEELGYSVDEIEDIISIDMETQFSEDIYTMRRILAFQGNKNHTAERYLFEAYYDNKIDMCNRLFPLLLEEKRGELILELFEFDKNLKNNMNSLRRFYYLALCLVEKDDSVFYVSMESEWMNYPEDEILDRMIRIAKEREDDFLFKQLELKKNKPRGNEFETAIINADNDTIRKYVKNANLLVELGYTPEEIQKINKIFELEGINNGTKPGQIANRVYLYQKNKNNLAENLYLNAIKEDSPEDILSDCKALFQIYTGQHNSEMVCKIFEKYLCSEMDEKFNRAYAATYCIALYELERYEEFLNYIRENKDRWKGFSLSANLLMVSEIVGTHEFDDFIWDNLSSSTHRPDIISKYMIYILEKDISIVYSDKFAELFNLFFAILSNEDIFTIAKKIKNISSDSLDKPQASILAAFVNSENSAEYISEWLVYMEESIDLNKEIDILLKLNNIFPNQKEMLVERSINLYAQVARGDVSDYRLSDLEEFIYKNIDNSELSKKWCDIQKRSLCEGKGSIHSLNNYLNIAILLGFQEKFWVVYRLYKRAYVGELSAQKLFEIVLLFYESAKTEMNETIKCEVADELIALSGESSLDYVSCKKLAEICRECQKGFEANVYMIALNKLIQGNSEEDSTLLERIEEKGLNYVDYLKTLLSDGVQIDFLQKCKGWTKYIVISEEEELVIERLRNTIKTADLWVTEEVNVLAKAIICEPVNSVYWKLFKTWIELPQNKDEVIIGAILYQLSSKGNKETESALQYAVDNNLKVMALDLTMKMLNLHIPDYNISAQKNVRVMIEKGWFSEAAFKDKSPEIIRKIATNIKLTDAVDYEWNSVCVATDLAITTSNYKELIDTCAEYLSKECAKQCCVIIAAMILKNHMETIEDVFECLDSSFADVPYKQLVHDFYDESKRRDLTVAEKKVLSCIQLDYGNVLGVNNLLGFYCDMCILGQSQLGLDTIRILMQYTPYDPVLYEVAACFLKSESDLASKVQFYEYMYEYLDLNQSGNPTEYAVGQMVCGENYLRLKGKDVKPFKKMIEERYPKYLDVVKTYQEFCDCVVVTLRTTDCEEFASILFEAVFVGNWVNVFKYKPANNTVNTVLSGNIKTERINVADDYYRSVIKSVALFSLKQSDNICDYSDRIRIIWNNIGNVGCSYDYFCDVLQSTLEENTLELTSIWTLDIETLTVYKKFFGKYVLEQSHCENYAQIFNVFISAKGGDIFDNIETQELLKSLDKGKAIEICRNYEQLYVRPSGPTILYATGKTVIKDSDYENNIFSNYLKRNTEDYYTVERRYFRFKKKYEMICEMNNIHSFEEANSTRFDLNEKRQIFSLRALYYYYSILSNQLDNHEFAGHRQAEIINAITMALSDDTYLSELTSFISLCDSEARNILGVLILVEQDKLDSAAQIVKDRVTGCWKAYLSARIVASYGVAGKKNSLCKICFSIAKGAKIENSYWIKNYKHAKSIERLDSEMYFKEISGISQLEGNKETNKKRAEREENEIKESTYDEILISSELPDEIDEMSSDIPDFIKIFLQKDYEEKLLCDLQLQWKELRDSVDNGKVEQDVLNELSIKIGICLIKRDDTSIDEKIMGEVFGLVKKYSIQDTYLITALHDVLQNYVSGYSDLDLLAASVYENRLAIGHLCYEQSMDQKSRIAQDIEAATILIEILTNIANDLSSAMGDESIKERLRLYQDELYKKTKKISKFRIAVYALIKMIQEKINKINYVPYLIVSHLGSAGSDNSKNYWNETWMEGADHGTVRGVVLNRGGAPAKNVRLNVMVNSEIRGRYTINEIAPGRKIPFVVEYAEQDINDGKVDWSANAIYYDGSNNKSLTSNGYGEILVKISGEEWGLSYVGREKFNTQFSAEGEEFCGRNNELLKLNNLYSTTVDVSRYPSLLVTGLRRAGKSSVIKYFKESLRKREKLAPIFVDAQGINGDITNAFFNLVFNELYRYYRNEMNGFLEFKKRWTDISKKPDWIGQLPTYFIELSELLGNRKVIFFLDEMENVFYANHFISSQSEEQFFGMIRSIIQNYQEYVSFIFCGSDKLLTSCLEQKRESQMFQVLQRIYVGRMVINDIRDMFDKYNSVYDIKFGDDAIDAIMYYTNGLIWYTKVIAYNILDRIIDQEHIIRDEIHVSDVDSIVELLISGDLGSELIDLLDNNFGAKKKAIIRAMARATKNPNESVSIDMISAELSCLNYVDNETGEVLGVIAEEEIYKNLNVLEKMDFIEKDSRKERAYRFTTELYRLLMLSERKMEKFIMVNGGDNNGR